MILPELFAVVLRASCLGSMAVLLLLVLRRVAEKSLSPRARCWLWLPVAALFVMPRLPDLGWHWQTDALPEMVQKTMRLDFQAAPVTTNAAAELAFHSSVKTVDAASEKTWWNVVVSVWVGGALCLLTLWLASYAWLLHKIRRGKTATPESLRALLADCARESGLCYPPLLIVSEAVESPAVAGLLRPAVLLPTSLGDRLEEAELRLVLLHEVGHLKRRDLWCHWLAALLLAVHWFNPLLWLAARLFRADREAACDAAVLASHREDTRGIYGSTLLKLQSHFVRSLPLRPMIGLLGGTDMLRQRILDIAHYGSGSRWAGFGAWLLTVGIVFSIAVMAEEPSVVEKDSPPDHQVTAPKSIAGPETREETLRRIDALAGVVERQISVSVKIVAVDPTMSWDTLFSDGRGSTPLFDPPMRDNLFAVSGVFIDPQFQVIMRALNQKKGVDILAMPTITTRSGLAAKVQLVKNMRYPSEFKPGENGKPAQVLKTTESPLGWSLEFEPILGEDGKTIDLNIKIENNAFEKWQTYGPGVKQPVLHHGKVTTSVSLTDGQTVGLSANVMVHDTESFAAMNPDDPPAARRRGLMIFITPKLVDPAGRTAIGQKSFLKGDHIEILQAESNPGHFEVGDRVIVKGRYQLISHDAANICLFTTQTQGDGTEKIDPSQKMKAEKGTHDFELSCTIRKKGYLHVSFYGLENRQGFGGVYFGSDQQMREFDVGDWPAQIREKKGSAPMHAPDQPTPRFVPNSPPVTPAKP